MSDVLRCAVMPIAKEHQVIIPETLLAGVTDETDNLLVMGAREGVIGKIQWRGYSIPLIAYESAIDFAIPYHGSNAKVAIVFNPSADSDLPFVAVSIQGAPKLRSLDEQSLITIKAPEGVTESLIASMVEIEGAPAFIPDFNELMTFVKVRSN